LFTVVQPDLPSIQSDVVNDGERVVGLYSVTARCPVFTPASVIVATQKAAPDALSQPLP
tara:strand:+ start:47620 stop:47796 length:177 start_codon:yes stop_codon:yes gene_type:complete